MRRIGSVLLTLFIVGAALASAVSPAQAGSSGNQQPPAAKQATARDIARANAKSVLASELDAWSKGQLSAGAFSQDVADFLAEWGPATFASARLAGPLTVMPPQQSLPLGQVPEYGPQPYCNGAICYCGPSTAVSILQYLHPTSVDGETLFANGSSYSGQFGLAGNFYTHSTGSPPYSWKYLETNVQGGETPWWSGGTDYPMPETINYWISGNYFGSPYYAAYHPSSVSDYEAKLKADIWNGGVPGYPLAGAVDELAYQLHLWGHPSNLPIRHWIALYGYASSGYYTSYIDPVAGSALGWPVNAYNTGWASSNMYTLVTNGGTTSGIVW